ncbi:large conductance mechanosensitive channel protein MscL [Anaerosphaera multitolerans]|uniref:Large-conductance mechanosensitive channel n=1 Tax=Anaerosphaera multitolerans TaxID=2487351 RepID=A0A437S8Z9_9FIRM|nr:large conductance mechanosensitive channel protein MscL [Anaerosphaera multitolerans]RVU55576.1 large conductance mechanosensitive channel protein MscL [Anaerosphaera multitolerans]
MKKFLSEFKDFISKGNVIDMAVGVIIGGAFGTIVSSLVDDIIMPIIGKIIGGIDFKSIFISLDGNSYASLSEAEAAGAAIIRIGSFIQNIVNFLIIAFVIFIVIKQMALLKEKFTKAEEENPTTKICPYCKTEINLEATRCPNCTSQLE